MNFSNHFLRAFASSREAKIAGFTRSREAAKALLLATTLFGSPLVAQVDVGATGFDNCAPLPAPEGPNEIVLTPCLRRTDIVVTASAARQAPEKSGRAVTLLDRATLDRLQTQSVADILSKTPGVTVSRNGGIGGFSAVRIRGAEGEQTLTLIDGIRVNDPSSPGGGFDFGNLLIGNIERIEVLRGPNSVPWGSQAIGGVVNVITAAAPQEFGGNFRAEYGYKDAASVSGNAGGRFGIVSASLGAGYFRDDGVSAFKDGTERDGYRQYAANGRVGVALTDDFDLDFRGYYADSRTRIDGNPPPTFSFADTPQFSKAQELFGYAGANLRTGALASRVAVTIADIDRDNFPAPGQAASFTARGRTERIEYQGDARLIDSIRAVFGVEHERSRFNDGSSSVKTNVTSGYAQIIADPFPTLTLTGGARIDDHRDYGTETTLSGNLAWRPARGTIIRAAYGEGFKAPTLFQLRSFFGNATLQPERAKSYEVGIEQRIIDNKLTLSLTAFQRNIGNQIDFVSCFGQSTGICTNRPFGTFNNIRRTRAKGLEASILAQPTAQLTINANYSYVDSINRDTDRVLLRRPKHSANLGLDWETPIKAKIGAALQLVSDSADSDFQTFTRTSLDGYALATIRASYPITDGIEIYGRVENLFDTAYETVSGYSTYGRNAHIGIRGKF